MDFITSTELQKYTGTYDIDASLATIYINSATDIVEQYLRYKLATASTTDYLSGVGSNSIITSRGPITALTSITIDGTSYSTTDFSFSNRKIRKNDGSEVFTDGIENVTVVYVAGYTEITIPPAIKSVILRIAALLTAEAGGNIGVSGYSMDGVSRNFISYANYNKYLTAINMYRKIKW